MPADFKTAYGKLIAATWQDPKVVKSLKANPDATLKKYGLPGVPAGASVEVQVVKPTGHGTIESQQASFVSAKETGKLTLWIPAAPTAKTWARVGSTVGPIVNLRAKMDGGNSCTCTPCCCCT